MIRKAIILGLAMIAGIHADAVYAETCGLPDHELMRIVEQAQAYATGRSYLDQGSNVGAAVDWALCSESMDDDAARRVEREEHLQAHAQAYAVGEALEVRVLADME
jgi:hypothetical protein